ncbi:MAG: ROK family protein [Acidimicrobiales bacterium]|nr:ROK family protein [Acidimicrobiales bacterium]
MRTIGIDVGGTKVLGVVLSADAPTDVLIEHRVPTPPGGEGLVAVLAELVDQLRAEGDVAAVGVGVPGLVDRAGVLRVGPHLPRLRDVPLADELAARTGVPVEVDNDANGHAVAEHRGGAAAGVDEALVVSFGTGIGAGIITGGKLLRGANGFAGEPGHMIVDPNGPPCPCGRRGCWERFASGTGLGRLARDAALGGRLDLAVDLAGGDPELVRGEHVTAAARQNDPDALGVLHELARWIAIGLANLANIVDPGIIVMGGGLVEAADLLLPPVRTHFGASLMAVDHRPAVPIVPAVLGEQAGAIGVALLAAELV